MKFNFNDGGRSKYFKGKCGDCVVRAIAISLEKDYKEVYDKCKKFLGYSPRDGVRKKDTRKLMEHFGFKWNGLMGIGTGCTTHLRSEELPKGRIVCKCSSHLVTCIDGVVNDTHDSSRCGTRCVYGYWFKEN